MLSYLCMEHYKPKNIKYVRSNRFSIIRFILSSSVFFFGGVCDDDEKFYIHTHKKIYINIQFFIIVSVKNFFDQYMCVCVYECVSFLNCDDFIFHVFLLLTPFFTFVLASISYSIHQHFFFYFLKLP